MFQFALQKYKIKVQRNIILSLVLYWCEIWSVIFREKQKLWVFENGLLKKIFGPKREGVTGEPRRLHKEALHEFTPHQGLGM